MGVPTHVMHYSGDLVATMGRGAGPLQFQGPLGALDGTKNWYVLFYALPPGKTYEDLGGSQPDEYIQAAGRSGKMTVEICMRGGHQWGADTVRYIIGHAHEGNPPLDVTIELPHGSQTISVPEVFEAEEAAQLFISYHKTGNIPEGYVLRLVEGYTSDDRVLDRNFSR